MKIAEENLPFNILLAEDDEDDILLTRDAMSLAGIQHKINVVKDGQALLAFLKKASESAELTSPNIILLDLNMPVMDGREVLKALKSSSDYRGIPVVVLSTSEEIEDIDESYSLGASGYFSKPTSFEDLVKLMQTLSHYWYDWAQLPKSIH